MKKSQKAWRIAVVAALTLLFAAILTLPAFMREPLAWLPGWKYLLTMLTTAILWCVGFILLWPLYAHNKTPERKRKTMIIVVILLVVLYALRAWTNIERDYKIEYLHSPNNINTAVARLQEVSYGRDATYGYVTRVQARFFYEVAYKDKDNAVFLLSYPEERTFTWIDDYTLQITRPLYGDPNTILTDYIRW